MLDAGSKVNIIPEQVDIALDVRVLPGDGRDEVTAMVAEALGDLFGEIDLQFTRPNDTATSSPMDNPFVEALGATARRFYEGAELLPMRMVGTTDARHFRRVLGTAAYGFGLFSDKLSIDDIATMGHGDNERIDTDSLELSTDLWEQLARDFLS